MTKKTGDFAKLNVSDDEAFAKVWQKAIDDMVLRFIGCEVTLHRRDMKEILREFVLVRDYVQKEELRENERKYVTRCVNDVLDKLETFWLTDFDTLDMGKNLHLWRRREYDSDEHFFDIPADSIIKESATKDGKYYIVYMIPGEFRNKVRGNDSVRVNTHYAVKGSKARSCTCYDRGLCDTIE